MDGPSATHYKPRKKRRELTRLRVTFRRPKKMDDASVSLVYIAVVCVLGLYSRCMSFGLYSRCMAVGIYSRCISIGVYIAVTCLLVYNRCMSCWYIAVALLSHCAA